MTGRQAGFLSLTGGIILIISTIKTPPTSSVARLSKFEGYLAGIGFIVAGILLILGYLKWE